MHVVLQECVIAIAIDAWNAYSVFVLVLVAARLLILNAQN